MNKNYLKAPYIIIVSLIINLGYAQEWNKANSYSHSNYGTSLGVDKDFNVYFTSVGVNFNSNSSYYKEFLSKIDDSGSLLWLDTLSVINSRMTCDNEGNSYVVGQNKIIKYDRNGLKIWEAIDTEVYAYKNVIIDPKGQIIAVGHANINDSAKSSIQCFDVNGNKIWNKFGLLPLGILSINADSANYFVVGQGYPDSTTGNSGFLAKLDLDGSLLWQKSIPNTPERIVIDKLGHLYVLGWFSAIPITINGVTYYANSSSNPEPQFLLQFDRSGVLQWFKLINGFTGRGDISVDANNSLFLGFSYSTVEVDNVIYTQSGGHTGTIIFKFDSNGLLQWTKNSTASIPDGDSYPHPSTTVHDIKTFNKHVYVCGGVKGFHEFGNYAVENNSSTSNAFLAELTDYALTSSNSDVDKFKEFDWIRIFPNPSKGFFTVSYQSNKSGTLFVSVKNSLGQLILREERKDFSGLYMNTVNLTKQANGIYFVEIICGDERRTRKIVLER